MAWHGAAAALPPPAPLPPISAEDAHALLVTANLQGATALAPLLEQVRQRADVAMWPMLGYYEALLSLHAQRPQAGLEQLSRSLPYLQHQWHSVPSLDNAQALALGWQLQSQLYEQLGNAAHSATALQRASTLARQALPTDHPLRQWLGYAEMEQASRAQQWPQAHQHWQDLVAGLSQPLAQCQSLLCLQLRFYQLRIRSGLQQPEETWPLALALQATLRQTPQAPVQLVMWTQHLIISLALQRQDRSALRQQCEQLRHSPWTHHPEAQTAWTYARAMCAEGLEADTATLQELLQQETQARGWASPGHGHILLRLAEVAMQRDAPRAAQQHAAQAWAVAWARQDWQQLWESHYQLAYAMENTHRLPEAVFHAKLAAQAQRLQLHQAQALSPEHADQLLAHGQSLYDDLAQWLLQLQRIGEAERAMALARTHSYHRLVRGAPGATAAPAVGDPAAAVRLHLPELPWTPEEQARWQAVQPLQAALQAAWQQREHDPDTLGQLLQALRPSLDVRMTPASAAAADPTGQWHHTDALPPHTTEVRLLPGRTHLYALVRRAGQPDVQLRLALTEHQLVQHIAQLRQLLQQPDSDVRPVAQQLYQALWAPLQPHLPAGQPEAPAGAAPELQLHLEGVLRYLPVALLHDGQHWLGASYALALHSPQSTAQPPSTPTAPRQGWALLGRSAGADDLPALPHVTQELHDIAAQAQAHGIAHQLALNQHFTAPALSRALTQQQVVHLASHFRLVPGNGAASGLLLGDGQWLSLPALERSAPHWQGLELLTLSACETALPMGPGSDGATVDSLAWLAQSKGAQQVLASLWPVADQGTQAFMHAFYQALASGLSHAQAVRAAQLALLQPAVSDELPPTTSAHARRGLQPVTTQTLDAAPPADTPTAPWVHPYYWGAFVLLGGTSSAAAPSSAASAL